MSQDNAQRRRINAARKLDQERVYSGVRKALGTREGRRMLWRMFEWTDVLGNAFRDNARDTAFALGRQSIGQELLALLEEVDPGAWLALRAEQLLFLEELREKNDE